MSSNQHLMDTLAAAVMTDEERDYYGRVVDAAIADGTLHQFAEPLPVINGHDTSTLLFGDDDVYRRRRVETEEQRFQRRVLQRLDRIERLLEEQERRRLMAEHDALTRAWRGPR